MMFGKEITLRCDSPARSDYDEIGDATTERPHNREEQRSGVSRPARGLHLVPPRGGWSLQVL
jgi:hypothetical protein